MLPDPSPLLGLRPDQVQPAYGFARGFDLSRFQQAGFSNVGPLLQLVKDCGWQQPQQQQRQQQGQDDGPRGASGSRGSSGSGSGSSGVGGDGVLWRRVPVVVKDVAGLVPGGVHCTQHQGLSSSCLHYACVRVCVYVYVYVCWPGYSLQAACVS